MLLLMYKDCDIGQAGILDNGPDRHHPMHENTKLLQRHVPNRAVPAGGIAIGEQRDQQQLCVRVPCRCVVRGQIGHSAHHW